MNYSPTKLQALQLCPKFKREDILDDDKPEITQRGTRIHEAIATQDWSKLKDGYERDLAAQCQEHWKSIVRLNVDPSPRDKLLFEQKLTFLEHNYGIIDWVYWGESIPKTAFVRDWKFGLQPVDQPKHNIQAICYSLAVFEMIPECTKVDFAFVQPTRQEEKRHVFKRSEVGKFELQLRKIIERSKVQNAYPVINQYCKYCKAIESCPAVKLAIKKRVPEKIKLHHLADLPEYPERTAEALNSIAVLEKFLKEYSEKVKAIAKTMLGEGREIPNWTLEERGGSRYCRDIMKASEIAAEYGNSKDFVKACSLTLNKLPKPLIDVLDEQGLIARKEPIEYLKKESKTK